MGNIELFALDNTIGNKVLIYLNSGKEISGVVAEIGDNFILITKEDGKQMRLFENIIGAWETIESVPDSALPDNDDPSEKEGNNTQLSVSSDSMPIAEPKPATENEPLKEGPIVHLIGLCQSYNKRTPQLHIEITVQI